MPASRALLAVLLVSCAAIPERALAQTATTDPSGRPITPAPVYQDGQEVRASRQQPQDRFAPTGRRLDVPPLGGAAAQSTSGGRSSAPRRERDADGEALRRLDPEALAGGQSSMSGGDYGTEVEEAQPLAGGDYGVPVERQAPTVTIGRSALGDPLAAAPRGFRNSSLPVLRRLPDPSTLTAPGEVDPNDPYAPIGIRAGAFLLRPTLESAVGYDTNPDRTAKRSGDSTSGTGGGGPKGSKYSRLRGDLDVQSDWARHALDFRGSGEIRKDFDIKDSGYEPQFNAALSGRIDVTKQTQLNGELRGSIAAARPGDPETTQGIDGEEITRQAGVSVGAAHRFNRLSLRLDGLVDRYTVDDAKLKTANEDGSRKVDNSDRAYNQYEARLRGSYELSPRLEPFAEIAIDTRDYDRARSTTVPDVGGAFKLGSDGYALRTGAKFEATRLVTGEASIGYGRQTPNDSRLKATQGLLIDGSVAWAPSALTTVRLGATSALQETTLYGSGAGGVLSRNFDVSVEHRLRRNWSVTARGGFEYADYQGSTRKDKQTTLALETEYRLNRSLALTGNVQQLWLNSSLPGEDYKASIIEFGLKYRR
ncbi:outer membrane beta-barrel protein [Methylopila sp. M107]|uniref:outer membrane beta-barrel protein n=1 Tax=Methylopila sp. M107 TaxID=1101190 RepID=UPI000365231F|nr:outer membrane beta-barrel protein [Methylopila sp. M107]